MKKGLRFIIMISILFLIFLINFVLAEKIGLEIKEGNAEKVVFIATLYSDDNGKVNGELNYEIQDYYTDIIGSGKSNSGEEVIFNLPKNPKQGPWKIIVKYNNIETNELFEVGKLEKADIRLDGDNLIIENLGNVQYDRNILIYIGDVSQVARVLLEVGQVKKIKLSAPSGEYTIKVNDGSEENNKVFQGVSLTGNVVGLERVSEGGFWKRYPIVGLFLVTLLVVTIVVFSIKFYKKNSTV